MERNNIYQAIIIEPSVIVQQGIRTLLETDGDFEVVHCFPDYAAFEEDHHTPAPDLILMNPMLVNFHKQYSVKNFFPDYPDTALIAILYSYVDPETINSFDGFIDIYDDYPQIEDKLKKILDIKQGNDTQAKDTADLSDREKEILISVAQGLTNKEIADRHNISVHTVISHRKNITRKTGIKTVSGLTIYAVFNGLISKESLP